MEEEFVLCRDKSDYITLYAIKRRLTKISIIREVGAYSDVQANWRSTSLLDSMLLLKIRRSHFL